MVEPKKKLFTEAPNRNLMHQYFLEDFRRRIFLRLIEGPATPLNKQPKVKFMTDKFAARAYSSFSNQEG